MRGLEAPERAPDHERLDAEQVLAHMLERHHPRLALACSFQKEDAVLIDMLLALEPSARVFTIDTGVLFPETYEAWRALEDRYGVRIEVFDALRDDGTPWTADGCCTDRKIAALEAALADLDGWISGVRREQSPTRADAPKLALDTRRGIWKANPLADWTAERVWSYIARHDVPYNELHDRGYESIGCAPCTLPGAGRDGRWAGSERTECGIHV
jgi:phosphoadenosine phosphosulfate reductase